MDVDKLLNILENNLSKENPFFPCFLLSGLVEVSKTKILSKNDIIKIYNLIYKFIKLDPNNINDSILNKAFLHLKQMSEGKEQLDELSSLPSISEENALITYSKRNSKPIRYSSPETNKPSTSFEVCQSGGGKLVNLISKENNYIQKFRINKIKLVFQIKDSSHQEINNLIEWLEAAFEEIIKEIALNCTEGGKAGLTISVLNNPEIKPVWVSIRPITEIDGKLIVSLISDVNQSNSMFFSDEILQVEATVINCPFVGGKYGILNNEVEIIKHKTSIKDVCIKNDFECLPKCICYSIELLRNVKISPKKLCVLSKELCKKALVKITPNKGCLLSDIYKFQTFLKEFQIIAFDNLYGNIFFKGPPHFDKSKKIYLYYSEIQTHFFVITSPTGFFNKKYICIYCDKLFNNKSFHRCEMQCCYCYTSPPCVFTSNMKRCNKCNREFRGDSCFDNHLIEINNKKSICETFQICRNCGKFISYMKKRSNHVCGEYFCTFCFNHVPGNHLCYMQPYKKKQKVKYVLIFFDCESTQNVQYNNNSSSFQHIVNLVVAQHCCFKCSERDMYDISKKCEQCGVREHVFKYEANQKDVIEQFVDYCFENRSYASRVICIAHNLQGYDGHFVISEIMKRKIKVLPIMNGHKIMKLTCGKVSFIDSLNFLPFALSKLPKIFGIENIQKGFYPFLFNTLENWNYIGPYPPEEMYGINTFKKEEREQFIKWYKSQQNNIFINKNELIEYCTNDVNILRISCLTFMNDFVKMSEINPFIEALTIASTVMLQFRKNFLKENELGIMPNGGYISKTNQSSKAIKWLLLQNSKANGNIQSILNCGEFTLPNCNFKVDGFDADTNTVYEFFGCFYHGCIKCFQSRTFTKFSQKKSLDHRYESTCKRIKIIKRLGYNLVCTWECQFDELIKENPDIRKSVNKLFENFIPPLNPRDAITGGRTELFASYYNVQEDEHIKYLDFTSLYPFVNKYAPYPILHPKILKGKDIPNWKEVIQMHGFIKCKTLPPQNVNIPVLPYKTNNRLYFPLCRTCSEKNNISTKCSHDESERVLIGTWVIPEVNLAIAYNYEIKEIFEVWQYNFSQYDPKTRTGGLFSDYVNTFLKIKQESSGWPSNCTTEEEKEQYIQMYKKQENIELDKSKIAKNPGLRHEAKLCLNSFWGKFAQRQDKTQTTIVQNFQELSEFINCPIYEVSSIYVVNKDTLWVNWKYISEEFNKLNHANIPIGAYTTSYARMELYKVLSKIPHRVLYCDTDSIIFIEKKGESTFETSNFLGGLTNELECYGSDAYISEYVSIGPKSYSLKIKCSTGFQYITKCKGVSINFKNSELINFQKMKNMVLEEQDPTIVEDKCKIKRKMPGTIVSEFEAKRVRFTFEKRVLKDNYFSHPYGFTDY